MSSSRVLAISRRKAGKYASAHTAQEQTVLSDRSGGWNGTSPSEAPLAHVLAYGRPPGRRCRVQGWASLDIIPAAHEHLEPRRPHIWPPWDSTPVNVTLYSVPHTCKCRRNFEGIRPDARADARLITSLALVAVTFRMDLPTMTRRQSLSASTGPREIDDSPRRARAGCGKDAGNPR